MSKLTDKQEFFCQEYIKDFNGTEAAIRAGYSKKTARSIASELLTKPNIQKRIQELTSKAVERNEISVDKILKEIAAVAFLDIKDFYDEVGNLKKVHDIDDLARRAISSVSGRVVKEGEDFVEIKTIKANDKLKALELLGRFHKMFTDKIELGASDDLMEWLQSGRK